MNYRNGVHFNHRLSLKLQLQHHQICTVTDELHIRLHAAQNSATCFILEMEMSDT